MKLADEQLEALALAKRNVHNMYNDLKVLSEKLI